MVDDQVAPSPSRTSEDSSECQLRRVLREHDGQGGHRMRAYGASDPEWAERVHAAVLAHPGAVLARLHESADPVQALHCILIELSMTLWLADHQRLWHLIEFFVGRESWGTQNLTDACQEVFKALLEDSHSGALLAAALDKKSTNGFTDVVHRRAAAVCRQDRRQGARFAQLLADDRCPDPKGPDSAWEVQTDIASVVALLDPDQQKIIMLVGIKELSDRMPMREAASALKISVSQAYKKYTGALARVRELLGERGYGPGSKP